MFICKILLMFAIITILLVWLELVNTLSTISSLQGFNIYKNQIPDWLIEKCYSIGYNQPTEVQDKVLPLLLDGKDVIFQSHTGSGKTLAFALPVLARINPQRSAIQSVIIVPTRELGIQVSATLKQLASNAPEKISIMSVVEGSKNRRQMIWAKADPPHIVVGNPRALLRLIEKGHLRLNAVSCVVLDEVDACLIDSKTRQELHRLLSRHLSKTFQLSDDNDVQQPTLLESRVYRDLARDKEQEVQGSTGATSYRLDRQTIMCSATIPQRQHFAVTCHKQGWTAKVAELVNVAENTLVPSNIEHQYIECPQNLRLACMQYLLQKELEYDNTSDSTNASNSNQSIIFIDRKLLSIVDSIKVAANKAIKKKLNNSNNNNANSDNEVESEVADVLTDDMNIEDRGSVLRRFRDGELKALICTDMASRGLDIPNTSLIIQLNLPNKLETYLHRSGRTGRLNRPGKVVTLIDCQEMFVIQRYENELGVRIKERKLKAINK